MHQTHEHGALMGETRAGGGAGSWGAKANHGDGADCVASADAGQPSYADTALLHIEGEAYAQAFIDRLHGGTARPGELAALLTFLGAELMHGACRAIEKALQGGRHG